MPIVKTFSDSTLHYTLWKIEEDFPSLEKLSFLSEEENLELKSLDNTKRRLEWIAARVALKQSVENLGMIYSGTYKDQFGRPHLLRQDKNCSISLSHSGEFAIAAVSETHEVGIDIQKGVDSLHKIRSKFLSEVESSYAELSTTKLSVIWSAKEAVYKISCERVSSIKEDILIQDFELQEEGFISATIPPGNRTREEKVAVVYHMLFGEHAVAASILQ